MEYCLTALVVGTGPAGMLAAYGALREGCDVTVVAQPGAPVRSTIHGAQYIQQPVEGLPTDIVPFRIRYRYLGDEAGYREKIYGDGLQPGESSWGRFSPYELAWPMDQVYDWLAEEVLRDCNIVEMTMDRNAMVEAVPVFDYVFNTAPLNRICPDGNFRTEAVWVSAKNHLAVPKNEIWYIGLPGAKAYRASNINGVVSTEYPRHARAPRGAVAVEKPLRCSNIDLPGVHRLGRYGKWHKGILAHEAYDEARRVISRNLPWTATLPA
jgi:hypothetical protein